MADPSPIIWLHIHCIIAWHQWLDIWRFTSVGSNRPCCLPLHVSLVQQRSTWLWQIQKYSLPLFLPQNYHSYCAPLHFVCRAAAALAGPASAKVQATGRKRKPSEGEAGAGAKRPKAAPPNPPSSVAEAHSHPALAVEKSWAKLVGKVRVRKSAGGLLRPFSQCGKGPDTLSWGFSGGTFRCHRQFPTM